MTGNTSFQQLLTNLDSGDSSAAVTIHNRYVNQLIGLAHQRMEPKLKSKFDPCDIVQSVFHSFYQRQSEGRFEHESWGSLWSLLAQITVRKCRRRTAEFHAAKRDIARELPLVHSADEPTAWQPPSREPLPEEAAMLEETMTLLMKELAPVQREIVALKLQRYSHEEIAHRVDRTRRTVTRVLSRVKHGLAQLNDELDTRITASRHENL